MPIYAHVLFTICHNTPALVIPAPPENDADVLQVETEFADADTGHVLVIRGVYYDGIKAETMEPSKFRGRMVSYADFAFVAKCIHCYN